MILKILLPVLLLLTVSCTGKAYFLNKQGIELAESGKHEKALEKFDSAIKEAPKSQVAYLNLSRTYLIMKKPKLAIAPAKKAIELMPDNMEAYLLLTQAHFMLKEYEAAGEILRELAEKQPDNPFLYLASGDICLADNQWKMAENNYQKALSLDPESDRAYLQLGRVYMGKEMERYARKEQPAVPDTKNPGKVVAHMANMVASGGLDLDRASACFRKAVYLNPKNLEARIMLGMLAFQRTEYQQAALEWEEALRLDPKNGFLYMALGLNAQQTKQYEKAARYYQITRELAPKQIRPVILQILLTIDKGEHVQAVRETLQEKSNFPTIEERMFQAFSFNRAAHVPWLISTVNHPDRKIAEFSARALAYLSGKGYTLDREYWEKWWQLESETAKRSVGRQFFGNQGEIFK